MSDIKTRLIYSGCGCEVIEHFPDYCPTCRITELEAKLDAVKALKPFVLGYDETFAVYYDEVHKAIGDQDE